jgi:hypothetical protein
VSAAAVIRGVGEGLHAALLLARGRADGLALLNPAPDAAMATAARSFWAVVLCLPAFICLHLLDWSQSATPLPQARGFALDLLGYVIGWVGFALISRSIAAQLGRETLWPRFIAVWNWCNVVQYLMLVLADMPVLLGLPDWISQSAWLVAMGWALWLEWFATGLALEIPPLQAVGLVALDVLTGLLLVVLTALIG